MARQLMAAILAMSAIGMLSGCAGAAEDSSRAGSATASAIPVATGAPWYDDVQAAEAATQVGATGTPCELPITFSVPAKWKVEPIELSGELAGLATMGGATARCEIDAKPAGNIGFLRVWVVDQRGVEARKGLEAFLAAVGETTEFQYRDTKAGPLDVVEVTYLQKSGLIGDDRRARALGVVTPSDTVLITLGGIDTEEFEGMLPAYALLKQSLKLTS